MRKKRRDLQAKILEQRSPFGGTVRSVPQAPRSQAHADNLRDGLSTPRQDVDSQIDLTGEKSCSTKRSYSSVMSHSSAEFDRDTSYIEVFRESNRLIADELKSSSQVQANKDTSSGLEMSKMAEKLISFKDQLKNGNLDEEDKFAIQMVIDSLRDDIRKARDARN